MAVESEQLPVGSVISAFKLKGIDGQEHAPADFSDKRGLLVVFSCNHCPYAKAAWPILVDLHQQFSDQLGFIAINSNDPETYPDDDFANMKKLAEEFGVQFPYVVDETQEVAKRYKAQCTPDPYLFVNENDEFKLFYHGRINDNWQEPDQVTEHNLQDAMQTLLAAQPAPDNQPPSMGCSIKWKPQ
jgi:thiol-disulfide isomerase/thioredoxin